MSKLIIVEQDSIIGECGIDYILQYTSCEIELLIVYNEQRRKVYEGKRGISKIVLVTDSLVDSDWNDFGTELIERYRWLQADIESNLGRSTGDFQQKKYCYYMSLNFWYNLFTKKRIDKFIIIGTNHGMLFDGIPYGVAKSLNICINTVEPDINGRRFLSEVKNREFNFVPICQNQLYKNTYDSKITEKYISKYEKKPEGWMKHFIRKMLGCVNCNILSAIKNGKITEYKSFNFKYTVWDKVQSYLKFKRTLRYLREISQPFDHSQKYIFYSLNFDPDASGNSSRHILESQLVIIKMLSDGLPDGWVLYVKEHPMYLSLNTNGLEYFIYGIENYRNKDFYQRINSFPNVKIIETLTDSEKLIEAAQAVVMMQGTNALGAIKHNKPLLMFSDKTPLVLCEDIFCITSFKQCWHTLKKIEQGFSPRYEDFESAMGKYLVDTTRQGMVSLFKALFNSSKKKRED